MKKLLFASAILFAASFTKVQAQTTEAETKSEIKTIKKEKKALKKEEKTEKKALKKLEGPNVSELAKDAFYADYGISDGAQWKRGPVFDEVAFTKDGQQMKAFYDADAQLVGTTTIKQFTDLPADAQKKIKAKYKDYKITHVVYYNDNEANESDMVLYGTQFDDADNYFVEMNNGAKELILQINSDGVVSVFSDK
jgi:hypothetical protein